MIHADIDPAEIGKNRAVDVPIVGDCQAVIVDLIETLRNERATDPSTPDISEWWAYLNKMRSTYPLSYDRQSDGSMSPEFVISAIGKAAGPDAVYVAGVGQHQMWAAQFISYEKPRSWLNSGGLGMMGYAVPAAMGARWLPRDRGVGHRRRRLLPDDQPGAGHLRHRGYPIKVALINNGNLGMVRQWQTLFYDERYSNTDLSTPRMIPDFVKLAEALGCAAFRVEKEADVDEVIAQARAINDRPVVIDFIVGKDAQVWLMVAAGTSNDEIMAAINIRPLFDEEDSVSDPSTSTNDGAPGHGRHEQEGRAASTTHTLSVLVEDLPGVLAWPSLFSRRGFNIESLAVGPTELAVSRG